MPENELKNTLSKIVKSIIIIYVALLALYFLVSKVTDNLPKPYHKRTISAEVTPWLK